MTFSKFTCIVCKFATISTKDSITLICRTRPFSTPPMYGMYQGIPVLGYIGEKATSEANETLPERLPHVRAIRGDCQ